MNKKNIDLNLLPVLDALLRHRSVTIAAIELGLSQSAMSAALARLRSTLGDPLFVRAGRGLLPTPRALALTDVVEGMLTQVRDHLLSAGGFVPEQSRRQFTICHSDVGSYVLWPRIVQRIRERAAGVQLRLLVLPEAGVASALESADADLAIGAYRGLPASLFQKRLFEREYVGLVRRSHPLTRRRLTAKAFAAAPQAVVRLPSGIQDAVERELARLGLRRTSAMEVPSALMLPPLIASSDYLAVVPGQLADAFMQHDQFAVLELPFDLPASVIRILWHRRHHEDAANAWLRREIADLFES